MRSVLHKISNILNEHLFNLLKNALRTAKLVFQASPWYFSASIMLMVPKSLIPPAQIWVTKLLVDSVVNQIKMAQAGGEINLTTLFLLVGLQLLFWIIREAVNAISEPINTILGEVIRHKANLLLAEKAASVALSYYDIPMFYDKLTRAEDYVRYPASNLGVVLRLISQSISLIAVLAMLARLGWLPFTIVIVTATPHAIFKIYFNRRNWTLVVNYTPDLRLMRHIGDILRGRRWAKEVRVFRLKDYLLNRLHKLWLAFFQERKRVFLMRNAASAFSGVVSGMGCAFTYGYAIVKAVGGQITLGDLTLYFQVANQVQSYLTNAFYQIANFYEFGLKEHVFYEFMDMNCLQNRSQNKSIKMRFPKRRSFPHPLRFGIELRNVSFKYPESERYVLKNVSFVIPARKKIAFVGENGAGKTTLVKLILGLYDPTEGEILLDGYPLHEYNREDLWRHMSVIFQDFGQYELTIRENIGFGYIEKIEDIDYIRAAAEKAGIRELIERLPKGYESYLGRYFEDPVDLSGGEWQKIALARLFMSDSDVLILDEPTASLDVRSEYQFYKRVDELTRGKTVILISHRFSTVRMADEILVIKDGRIVESGSHEELMAMKGLYAEMFNMQASRYVDVKEGV